MTGQRRPPRRDRIGRAEVLTLLLRCPHCNALTPDGGRPAWAASHYVAGALVTCQGCGIRFRTPEVRLTFGARRRNNP
jgi:hypothetical protein